jgi:RecB family exonuclease
LLAALEALAARLAPGEDRSATEWVVWLEDLLDDLGFPERTTSERERPASPRDDRDRAAFLRLRESLRALVLGELVTGGDDLSYEAFLDELRGVLDAATFHEDLPLHEPAVSVMGPLEARGARYPVVAVMGLSEGLLPEVEREDPFLDEPTRAALGLEPRLGREQGGLFYQAVTRADARLLLTRPYLADDGEDWEPSPFWRAVEELLDEPSLRIRPEDPRPLAEAASPDELLFLGVRRGGLPASLHEPLIERWIRLQHARDVLAARSASEAAGPHEGNLGELAEALSARFGVDHTWSPSRLESYGSCPHMFWTAYLLGLEVREPPEPGLDAAQLGSLLHSALEAAYRGADDPADPASVLDALERELDPIFEQAPEAYGFRPTPLWAIERQQYSQALRDTILALAEEGEGWTPTGFELAFGVGAYPPLELEAEGETVLLRGFIDRLDRRADGGLRVIDYKTGAGRLNQRELDEGRRLQLPLYAQGAQEALGLGTVIDGFYWAILAAKRGALRLAGYRAPEEGGAAGIEGAHAAVRRHVARIVERVRAGRFEPAPPPGGCPSYCPAAAWCWRYQPGPWG